jgi:phosphoglycolate phosphatase
LTYATVLFDLDGTLIDPKLGITTAVQVALARFGIEIEDRDQLLSYIGPPLRESFQHYHGLDDAQSVEAIGYYREHFGPKGVFENDLYPGIPELLRDLHDRGSRLIVATSKPTVYAGQIIDHHGLTEYFDLIVGSNLDHTRVAKTEVIAHVLAERPGIASDTIVMVGDREHDVIGARNNGLAAIGVSYGYGTPEELVASGAIAVVGSVVELAAKLRVES